MGPTMRELCPDTERAFPEKAWFAVNVRHQHERMAAGAMSAHGVETFLPLYRERRRWSDRVKHLDAPLFPGYVFGRFPVEDRVRVLRIPGVARIVGFGGSPAPVPFHEIDRVRAALASKLPIGPWPYPKMGDRVRIEDGPLRGVEGTLLRDKGALRLVLAIELLQRALAIEIDAGMIAPVRENPLPSPLPNPPPKRMSACSGF